MDKVHKELDEVKEEVERLKAECRVKTQLVESLKNSRSEESLKFQEIMQRTEKQARELDLKSEEICELTKIHEDLKSNLHEKETCIMHLSSENKKIQAHFTERLLKVEQENRELVLALDDLTVKNSDLEQHACASNKEISGLRTLLSAAEKKYLEAEEKVQESKTLRHRDDVILKLEEENRNMQDKMKWKSEQFKHLEEAHEKLQSQFKSDKEEWEKEKSALLEEITSLQTSLDSQSRILEGVQSRLEMCNHALAHQESRRKLLEAEISEFKSRFDDVFTQCEEEKAKIQSLAIQRNEEIAELRNTLGEKEIIVREMELQIVRLEQDNQELGDSLKELREAQIQNAGANSLLSKLRNKLRRLEEAHKNCASSMMSKESQWIYQVEKMEADISTYKSTLTSKEQEIKEAQMELENSYYAIEECSLELLIFKSELVEAYSKLFSAETDKAVLIKANEDMTLLSAGQFGVRDNSPKTMAQHHLMMEEELERHKKMLEESSEGQLFLKERLQHMESTLKYERSVASEAQEKLKLEIANKNDEIARLGCELINWKSAAETLKVRSEEIQGKCQKMENSLILQAKKEEALKHENQSLLCVIKEHERKTEDLQQQIALLEMHNAEKMKEAKIFKQEKESLVQIAEEKDYCMKDLQKDIAIACLQQESLRKELAAATLALLDVEKALKREKESHLKLKIEKDQSIKYLQELATSLEQDFLDSMCFSFTEQVEKWVEVSVLTEALKNAKHLTKKEIEEKNLRIMKSEESIFHLKQEVEQLQASLEAKKLETENLTEKQKATESIIREHELEKGVLLQDIMKLSTERERMLVDMEEICNKIGEFSGEDMQLMKTLGNILSISAEEDEWAKDPVVCDKLHDSTINSTNGSLLATTKKNEAKFDGRPPLREVNSLQM
ncbi:uncharacterized protein G2W53_005322 [Senna tora]|uniref:Uncharacterized protein n=1 Tax=Senna tora TaxID=362788 RepID=A0A834XD61_9FABA|nr:uncharacterized protein G2W53_005322 [Senna tora]